MPKSKVAVSLDSDALRRVDALVERGTFVSRSQAVEEALREKLNRLDRRRLSQESAKLDPRQEKSLAEEGISGDLESWPPW